MSEQFYIWWDWKMLRVVLEIGILFRAPWPWEMIRSELSCWYGSWCGSPESWHGISVEKPNAVVDVKKVAWITGWYLAWMTSWWKLCNSQRQMPRHKVEKLSWLWETFIDILTARSLDCISLTEQQDKMVWDGSKILSIKYYKIQLMSFHETIVEVLNSWIRNSK